MVLSRSESQIPDYLDRERGRASPRRLTNRGTDFSSLLFQETVVLPRVRPGWDLSDPGLSTTTLSLPPIASRTSLPCSSERPSHAPLLNLGIHP